MTLTFPLLGALSIASATVFSVKNEWRFLSNDRSPRAAGPRTLPLGILDIGGAIVPALSKRWRKRG